MTPLLVIVGYLMVLLVLGASSSRLLRRTRQDYMLASHSIGPVLLLMSLFGTTMTAFALVGSTGRAYVMGVGVYGMLASASGIMHSLCFFLVGVPMWRMGRRHGYSTQIQFFRDRLGSDLIGLLLFPILVSLVVSYLLVGVVASGEVVNAVTKGAFESAGWFASHGHAVPKPLASGTICGVVLVYVFFGGMRGTAWANAFQTAVFMVLGVVAFATIANAIGGEASFWENLKRASAAAQPPIDAAGPVANKLARGHIPNSVFFSFLLIPLSVAMFPHVFQHWLTARSAESFKLPIVMHPIFILIVWAPCVLIGVWASSPASGLPAGTKENEVLATLVSTHSGPILSGLLTAGVLAAIMSSLDSQFLCVGTMFTEDIVLRYSRPGRFTEQHVVWIARIFIVAIVAVTFLLSLYPRAVFDLGIWSFTGFCGLFPLAIAAIYWRRLTAPGAAASILAMASVWLTLFCRSGFGSNKTYSFPESPWRLGNVTIVPPLLPVVAVMLVAGVVLVIVSLLTRPPEPARISRFFGKK